VRAEGGFEACFVRSMRASCASPRGRRRALRAADAEREDAIVAARRVINLQRKVADDQKWLDAMFARDGSSLTLEQMCSRLAADEETLERPRAELRGWELVVARRCIVSSRAARTASSHRAVSTNTVRRERADRPV
jgi:hypothetical protein